MKRLIAFSALLVIALMAGCSYTMKIKDGDMAVDRKQYAVAVELLNKEYKKAKTRVAKGKLAFMLGESYKELNRSEESIQWYQTAYDYGVGVDALKEYAYALKRAERYDEAIEAFRNLGIEIGSPYEYRREINACEVAQGWKGIKYPEYTTELMEFNSGYADYSPQLYKDNQLVFTSDRKKATGDETYNWTGNSFSDLFLVDLSSSAVSNFAPLLNTENNEGTAAFNNDYSEVYFTRCFGPKKEDAHCKIMVSEVINGSWSEPRVLPFMEGDVNYGHPALSADGQRLYFSANHPDGWGGYDIWVTERNADGWGPPKVMGRSINSIGNEKFPYLDQDTLYFSSDWHTGMGGLDIFKSVQLSNGSWSPAFNLKPPINSGGDDFGFVIDHSAATGGDILQMGYFTSRREDGLGNDDIYRFEKRIPPPEPVVETPDKPVEYKLILEGYVLEKIFREPNDPNSQVLGRKPLNGAQVTITIGGAENREVTVGEDGFFTLELEENTDYDFIASRTGYLTNDERFSTRGIARDPNNPVQTFEVEIVLDKIFVNKEIVLENIYYDFDKWDIREDARPTLDELAQNLKLNPDIRIQLGSHTDCRGSNSYNETLSQRRAQSAVDYLISKGIDASRLTARGFGENQPAADCVCSRCTEEEHQMNRRTTFAILE